MWKKNLCAGRESGRRAVTVVADFAEDPVTRDGGPCAAVGTRRDGPEDPDDVSGGPEDLDDVGGRPENTDDVGNRCYCDSSVAQPRRCTRWYPRLRAAVEGRSQRAGGVGVLINCAGVSYPHPEYFAGMRSAGRGPGSGSSAFDADYCDAADASVRCNVAAAVHTCRLVLPAMLARGRGLVVNVGSASASAPPGAPLMTLYAATKVKRSCPFLQPFRCEIKLPQIHTIISVLSASPPPPHEYVFWKPSFRKNLTPVTEKF